VLGIQPDSTGACTLFLLLLRGLSAEETMPIRLTHDLCCNWTDEFPRCLLFILETTVLRYDSSCNDRLSLRLLQIDNRPLSVISRDQR
jgi:hypothetical protein